MFRTTSTWAYVSSPSQPIPVSCSAAPLRPWPSGPRSPAKRVFRKGARGWYRGAMMRQKYDTDLTDAEWTVLAPLIPPAKPGVRPRKHDMREILNAIRYVLRAGCAWRLLPHELPPWQTVYRYLRRWEADGTWQRLNTILREHLRRQAGREP